MGIGQWCGLVYVDSCTWTRSLPTEQSIPMDGGVATTLHGLIHVLTNPCRLIGNLFLYPIED